MEMINGYCYFIKDEFFEYVNDTFLKKNYLETKRPHFFAVKDEETNLYWMVPISSKVEKYRDIVLKKEMNHQKHDVIQFNRIANKECVLLFADMFPINEYFIDCVYIRSGDIVAIRDNNDLTKLNKIAKKTIKLIRKNVKLLSTQIDALRIENLMIEFNNSFVE